jgi:putative flippase GtrA
MKPTDTLVRFLLVGLINTLIGLGSIYFLLWAGSGYWISTFIGNGTGAAVSYFLNKAFTFKSSKPFLKSALLFALLIAGCYLISYTLSRQAAMIMESYLPFQSETAAVLIGTILYSLLNYMGQKYVVFKG